jgi:hypothetical protein
MGLSQNIGRHLLAAGIAVTVTGLMPHRVQAQVAGDSGLSTDIDSVSSMDGGADASLSFPDFSTTADQTSASPAVSIGAATLQLSTLPTAQITPVILPEEDDGEAVKYTLLGDADLNGIVNGIDFGILAANFNKGVTGWDQGDFDYTNIVNGIDFGDLAANFNKSAINTESLAALEAFVQANGLEADVAAAVPEPASTATIALVGILGLAVVPRRLVGRRA